jgi:hypothetical protein
MGPVDDPPITVSQSVSQPVRTVPGDISQCNRVVRRVMRSDVARDCLCWGFGLCLVGVCWVSMIDLVGNQTPCRRKYRPSTTEGTQGHFHQSWSCCAYVTKLWKLLKTFGNPIFRKSDYLQGKEHRNDSRPKAETLSADFLDVSSTPDL